MITDPYDVYSDILTTRSAALFPHVIPIYAPNHKNVPVCVGSGTLLSCEGRFFLATAAHVVRDIHLVERRTLYILHGGATHAIEKQAQITAETHSEDVGDPFDICVFELSDAEVEGLISGGNKFIPYNKNRATRFDASRFMLCFLGFPHSHNKGYNRKLVPKPYSFRAPQMHDAELAELIGQGVFDGMKGISPGTHYVIKFDKTVVEKVDGEKVEFPSMHGMSGSGIFTIGHISIESMLGNDFTSEFIGVFHSGVVISEEELYLVFTDHVQVNKLINNFF